MGLPIHIKLRYKKGKHLWHYNVVTRDNAHQELPYDHYTTSHCHDAGDLDHHR